MTDLSETKQQRIRETIDHHRSFKFCGPSDDLDEITAVTLGYRHLVVQLQRLASPILPEPAASLLNSLEVEVDNLYSAFEARAEIEAIILDIEEALALRTSSGAPLPLAASPSRQLPVAVCSIVGEALGSSIYHHKTLERLFYEAGAQGEVPDGNCVVKCQTWLKRMHTEVEDPVLLLGKVIEEFMEVDIGRYHDQKHSRTKIEDVFSRHGLSYHKGGFILGSERTFSTKSLKKLLQERDLSAVNQEFTRCLDNVETDPPAAITAACSILESLCKVYIEDNSLAVPTNQSIGPLWKVTSKDLGFDPSAVEDDDVKKILSGLTSVVDGIGSLRTHTGSAHGRGRKSYRAQTRHARLAIHASHTLVGFVIETWEQRRRAGT